MRDWGLITWAGILILVLVLLIYYTGAKTLVGAGSTAFGSTVRALTGQNSLGTPVGYAK